MAGTAPAAAQSLSPQEARIAAWADAHSGEAIGYLERLVNINSGTTNVAGVRAVGDSLRIQFDALGFTTRWVDMPPSMQRAGHLVAERQGTRGKRVLLIGHLDTVFEPDSPFQQWHRTGDRATGPGVNDMKGGDVVMLYALKALQSTGALDGSRITAIFTGDEELPGEPLDIARQDLIAAGKASDLALEFENGVRINGRDAGTIARRGATQWKLTVTGVTSHSSQIFRDKVGAGAIYEAARILSEFYDSLHTQPYLTFNPGVIVGGTDVTYDDNQSRGTAFGKDNVVAQRAVVTGDLRTISPGQHEAARAAMRAIVARHLPWTSAEITFAEGYPAMAPTPGNQALLDQLNAINRDLGAAEIVPLDPGLRGAGDISFVAPLIDGLAGLGPYGDGAHTPAEDVDLDSFALQIKRAALLIYRLTR